MNALASESETDVWRTTPRATDSEQLRSYNHLKLGIAAQLRGLMEILKKRASESRFSRCKELMTKLAEDRFTLAVLGQFKRGKSSLMNAIIGSELLPVGVLPLTSAITVLKFGPVERLVVLREDFIFPEIAPVSQLADYVTERGNPGNRRRVKTATVEVPLPFLRRGLEFVDTPGVGSAIEANTATTYAFLPECDAALFVTSADMPFTRVELEFLRAIRGHARKIFYVLNKTDLLADENERSEVLDFVARTIREQTGTERVFPVSARLALDAKIRGDAEASARGGLNALEEALAAFLSGEKASVFLAAIIDRAERLLDEESGEVDIFKKARELSDSARRQRLGDIRRRFNEYANGRENLFERLRAHLVERANGAVTPGLDSFLAARRTAMSRYVRRLLARSRWLFGVEVSERCGRWLLKRLRNDTESWLHDHANSPGFDSDEIARDLWSKILAGVSELSGIAAKAFDLPSRPSDDVPTAWRFGVKIESRLLRGFVWHPRITSPLLYSPSFMARSSLARALDAECNRLSGAAREDALALIETSVGDSLGAFTKEINARAEEMEARVGAAINGTRPPRRSPSQGMPPPETLDWGEGALDSIRDKLLALRSEALRLSKPSESDMETPEPPVVTAAEIIRPVEAKPPELRETETSIAARLRTRGCLVCDYLGDIAFNFFATKQYALYLDEKAQDDFAAARGFCPLHMWHLHAVSSPSGESVSLARLVGRTSRLLAQSSRAATPQAGLSALLPGANDCQVCKFLREAEREFILRLTAFLESSENRQAYAHSQGACLRHLVSLIQAVSSDETRRFLLAETARHFDETCEDMQGYAMKHAATRHPLTNADENDAAWRALVHLAGSRNLCAPWPTDGEI